jgi:hypothetical protein
LSLRGDVKKNAIRSIVQRLKTVPLKEVETTINEVASCTGFVVDEREDCIKILTSAHGIDHVFTASESISVEKVG